MQTSKTLKEIYDKLFTSFGPQHWWPGDTPFEVMLGAILTQNTNWSNVEKAITNLKSAGLLSAEGLHKCTLSRLATLIKPSGYFNVKAKRLKGLIDWLFENYDGDLDRLFSKETSALREELLTIKGIGPETADSIVLYAAGQATFVCDAYTYRICLRHQLISEETGYDELKALFEDALPKDAKLFNEYHALIVRLGKTYCKKTKPLCGQCPLNDLPHTIEDAG